MNIYIYRQWSRVDDFVVPLLPALRVTLLPNHRQVHPRHCLIHNGAHACLLFLYWWASPPPATLSHSQRGSFTPHYPLQVGEPCILFTLSFTAGLIHTSLSSTGGRTLHHIHTFIHSGAHSHLSFLHRWASPASYSHAHSQRDSFTPPFPPLVGESCILFTRSSTTGLIHASLSSSGGASSASHSPFISQRGSFTPHFPPQVGELCIIFTLHSQRGSFTPPF